MSDFWFGFALGFLTGGISLGLMTLFIGIAIAIPPPPNR